MCDGLCGRVTLCIPNSPLLGRGVRRLERGWGHRVHGGGRSGGRDEGPGTVGRAYLGWRPAGHQPARGARGAGGTAGPCSLPLRPLQTQRQGRQGPFSWACRGSSCLQHPVPRHHLEGAAPKASVKGHLLRRQAGRWLVVTGGRPSGRASWEVLRRLGGVPRCSAPPLWVPAGWLVVLVPHPSHVHTGNIGGGEIGEEGAPGCSEVRFPPPDQAPGPLPTGT